MEMTKKEMDKQINQAVAYAEEMKQLILSVCEDLSDSKSMTDAWNKIDKCYRDMESMQNRQKCTGAKSFSILNDDVDGHTKYLQGINLPIVVNSIIDDGKLRPSGVSEMHIADVEGVTSLVITPTIVG